LALQSTSRWSPSERGHTATVYLIEQTNTATRYLATLASRIAGAVPFVPITASVGVSNPCEGRGLTHRCTCHAAVR
jgi:hypothetical protein